MPTMPIPTEGVYEDLLLSGAEDTVAAEERPGSLIGRLGVRPIGIAAVGLVLGAVAVGLLWWQGVIFNDEANVGDVVGHEASGPGGAGEADP